MAVLSSAYPAQRGINRKRAADKSSYREAQPCAAVVVAIYLQPESYALTDDATGLSAAGSDPVSGLADWASGPGCDLCKTWNATLSGRHGRWLGSDPRHFPTEFTAIAHMTPAIEEWSLRHPYDLPRSLRCEELDTLRSLLAEGTDLPGPRFLTRN